MRTIPVTIYTFNELSDTAKEAARAWWRRNLEVDFDAVIEDATTVGALMGIKVDKILFSLGGSQGDGAMFVGSYGYVAEAKVGVEAHAPQDSQLSRIAASLDSIQEKNSNKLRAKVTHFGPYTHPFSAVIDVSYLSSSFLGVANDEEREEADGFIVSDAGVLTIKESLRDFMNWIEGQLQQQIDFELSNETVDADLVANECWFFDSGMIAGPEVAPEPADTQGTFTIVLSYPTEPRHRTKWHPTEETGPFAKLCRGSFESEPAAHAWASEKSVHPGTYEVRKLESIDD